MPYKVTENDRTPEGLQNLLKNYHFMATYLGGICPGKTSDGSTKGYKVENFFIEGVRSVEDVENLLRSEVLDLPHGIYLEPRNIKRAPAQVFNIFSPEEQEQLKGFNLPEEAIQLMKDSCFAIAEQHRGLGSEKNTPPADDLTEAIADQTEYDKYFKQYDELKRDEIADLVLQEDFADKFKGKPHFSSKSDLIRFYILHKHNIKPAITLE